MPKHAKPAKTAEEIIVLHGAGKNVTLRKKVIEKKDCDYLKVSRKSRIDSWTVLISEDTYREELEDNGAVGELRSAVNTRSCSGRIVIQQPPAPVILLAIPTCKIEWEEELTISVTISHVCRHRTRMRQPGFQHQSNRVAHDSIRTTLTTNKNDIGCECVSENTS